MQPLDAERVKEWRHRRMLSQHEVADRAGTSLFTIQRIERGEGNVRPKTGRGVAAALDIPIDELLPKAQAPLFRELSEQEPPEERREYKPPEAVDYGPPRWIQDKTIEELQQIALEEAVFAKPQTVEELFEGHKADKKAQLEEAHRRVIAWTNIDAINAELGRRGARSPVELAIKQYDEVMNPPEETPQEAREKQEDQRAG